MEEFVGYHLTGGMYGIEELKVFRFFLCFTVDVYDAVFYLKSISRKSDTTFYIVFAAVYRPIDYVTEFFRVCKHVFSTGIPIKVIYDPLLFTIQTIHVDRIGKSPFSFPINDVIVEVSLLIGDSYGISCREVEYYNIVHFHFTESRNTFIFPLWPLDIRFSVYKRQCMLRQRHREGGIGNTRAIAHFTYI